MTRWKNGKLDLGALGYITSGPTCLGSSKGFNFWWIVKDETPYIGIGYRTEVAARRAAMSWLRRALKQAAKRVEGGK